MTGNGIEQWVNVMKVRATHGLARGRVEEKDDDFPVDKRVWVAGRACAYGQFRFRSGCENGDLTGRPESADEQWIRCLQKHAFSGDWLLVAWGMFLFFKVSSRMALSKCNAYRRTRCRAHRSASINDRLKSSAIEFA